MWLLSGYVHTHNLTAPNTKLSPQLAVKEQQPKLSRMWTQDAASYFDLHYRIPWQPGGILLTLHAYFLVNEEQKVQEDQVQHYQKA